MLKKVLNCGPHCVAQPGAHQLAVMHKIISIIMVRGPTRYSTRYSATRQYFSITALHLLRQGFLHLCFSIRKLQCTCTMCNHARRNKDGKSTSLSSVQLAFLCIHVYRIVVNFVAANFFLHFSRIERQPQVTQKFSTRICSYNYAH